MLQCSPVRGVIYCSLIIINKFDYLHTDSRKWTRACETECTATKCSTWPRYDHVRLQSLHLLLRLTIFFFLCSTISGLFSLCNEVKDAVLLSHVQPASTEEATYRSQMTYIHQYALNQLNQYIMQNNYNDRVLSMFIQVCYALYHKKEERYRCTTHRHTCTVSWCFSVLHYTHHSRDTHLGFLQRFWDLFGQIKDNRHMTDFFVDAAVYIKDR